MMTGRSDIDEHGERVAPTANSIASDETALEHERYALLQRFEDWLETPMLVLAFVWLALLIVELIWGANAFFETIGTIIWIIFIANFVIETTLAPRNGGFGCHDHELTLVVGSRRLRQGLAAMPMVKPTLCRSAMPTTGSR